MENKSGKVLKIIAIIAFGLTTAMNVLGGVGTVCAAFLTKQYPPMWVYMDYLLLYRGLMIATILIGLAGIWATVKLIKGGASVYKIALIVLLIGTILGGTHYFSSLIIRGKAVPANVKFYLNAATLIFFLLFMLKGLRDKVDFSSPFSKGDKNTTGGVTAFLAGIMVLSTFIWVGPSHMYIGENWVEKFEFPIIIVGVLLLVGGTILTTRGLREIIQEEALDHKLETSV